ncbi:fimbrial protein [Burkholderia anthina]|uniref:Type-1 fimbrial protein n=1 Tax=Burkholderia anthina TaxID=179879 RepID=A0A6P2GD62_9BURK|nr:fimbrial protein [Burkholderia anthina]MBM2769081.1 type 1 fimbrial protein [Burkholderia anthina]VVU51555.1 type-1 fimbrial protein [Burkholderia anthina]
MKIKSTIALATFALAAASGTAMAQSAGTNSGQIDFVGEITTAPCSVDGDNANQTVQLGSISTNVLGTAGSTSTPKNFQINLTGCSLDTVKSASVTFDGTPDDNNPDLLKLGAGGSGPTAQNVAVAIYDVYNKQELTLKTASGAIPIQDGINALAFQAYYKSTASASNPVVAGSANANAQFTVSYN